MFLIALSKDDNGMNIGVLDDNDTILSFLETTLNMDGHTVYSYTSGESLMQTIPTQQGGPLPYDLVILDLLLQGGMSGADVFLTLRRRFASWELPIIIITAVSESTLEQFRLILPDDVPLLRKPFTPRDLRQLIDSLTGNNS
jgi:DNA-binding response OmpR family regulator